MPTHSPLPTSSNSASPHITSTTLTQMYLPRLSFSTQWIPVP
jgi:hypothetical protein